MSTVGSESVFLSALQPNTSVTTYGLPSEAQLDSGSFVSNETAKARRVQQQVQMRLAEKSMKARQNGSASQYAMSEYGGSSAMKYATYNPSYSSKSSLMYSGSRTMVPRVSHRAGYSSQSAAPEVIHFQKMSVGSSGGGGRVGVVSGGGGGGFYREEVSQYQGGTRQMDPETISLHSMRQPPMKNYQYMVDNSDAGSMMSDRDATFSRQYTQNTINGYSGQMRPAVGTMTFPPPMRRSLSSSLYSSSGGGGMVGGMAGDEVQYVHQQSFKGPAHRTISRITNRNRMSMGSASGTLPLQMTSNSSYGGGDQVDRGFIASALTSGSQGNIFGQRQGTLSRAMSIRSMQSVGKGFDIYNGMEMGASMGNLNGIDDLDLSTALLYLQEPDQSLQVLGAAFIQHECYTDKDTKNEVRLLQGIRFLVKLVNSENAEVQRYATGAIRNVIYENMENKMVLIEEGGLPELVSALKNQDDEVHKNVTGILWNLSSKDTLKEKVAKEAVPELNAKILAPLLANMDTDSSLLSPSETDIIYNTTGCLRNLSSVNEKTRQLMRGTEGLVFSLVKYIRGFIENGRVDDKGVENSVCVLRNLSYQLYNELPPSIGTRLLGPTRDASKDKVEPIGCFTTNSRKLKNTKQKDGQIFSELTREPKGMDWLWHPQIIGLYKTVLIECDTNSTTREAATGALQNITAGDARWAGTLSRLAVEQERIIPVIMDLLSRVGDKDLRSLMGLLRNLSRHAENKSDIATRVVSQLLEKLPDDGMKKADCDVVVNICGVLNNLVINTDKAARDITYFDGLPKLLAIKEATEKKEGVMKASKAAATVLSNMYMYKKLHKSYREKGFTKESFLSPI